MLGRRTIDPFARRTALAVGVGRVALGLSALLATRPSLRALGFPEPNGSARALARLTGGRDIALGGLAVVARDDPRALRAAVLAAAGVDLIDALALGHAASKEETKSVGMTLAALLGASAAATGAWVAQRL